MMHFMYVANEVRDFDRIPKVEGEKVPQREIDLGKNLIDKMSAVEFEPEKYHDEYRERFLAMIDRKAKGQEVAVQHQRLSADGRYYGPRSNTAWRGPGHRKRNEQQKE